MTQWKFEFVRAKQQKLELKRKEWKEEEKKKGRGKVIKALGDIFTKHLYVSYIFIHPCHCVYTYDETEADSCFYFVFFSFHSYIYINRMTFY